MNYKKVFKRETKVIAYVVIALTLVVIGTSYALFLQVNNNQDNQVVTAGSLVIEYAKGNTVTVDENAENNCLKPQSDTTGADTGGCNFTLSITNKGTLPMQYDLLIYNNTTDVDIPSDAQFVDHFLVRHSLNKQYSKEGASSEIVTAGKALSELETKEDKRVLESSRIGVGETITFSLNIWISEDATVDIIGQYVYLKLDVIGSVSEHQDFDDYIINQTSIEKFEHAETEQTKTLTDYRYTGANPNNYVYFGCEGDTCTEDNLYRIIGVMPTQSSMDGSYENRVKLIKANYYTENESGYLKTSVDGGPYPPGGKGYLWNDNMSSDWETSTLQKYVLNEVYWNSLGEYQKYIALAKWHIGAPNISNNETYTSDQFYNLERSSTKGNGSNGISFVGNIGLIYSSDYGYSMGSKNRNNSIYEMGEKFITNAWLYNLENNEFEWTLTPASSNEGFCAWHVNFMGRVENSRVFYEKFIFGIRPSFYLKSDVLYESGNGSQEEPYRITL